MKQQILSQLQTWLAPVALTCCLIFFCTLSIYSLPGMYKELTQELQAQVWNLDSYLLRH